MKTVPAFHLPDGSIDHWKRFDNVYRTQKLDMMFVVVDIGTGYSVLRLDARFPQLIPAIETTYYYHGQKDLEVEAYIAANQCAERLSILWSNRRRGDR
jgi:hypothetical protein